MHCGTEAAAGAVAFGCIRCLNRKEVFREKRRKGKVKGKCETRSKGKEEDGDKMQAENSKEEEGETGDEL